MDTLTFGHNVRPIREGAATRASVLECRSGQQLCALGPPPPRTPGRADPQVPATPVSGRVLHGRIPHLYFHFDAGQQDAAFGMLDIEIAVCEPARGRSRVELYCVGDGYQAGTGTRRGEVLVIELRSREGIVAVVEWRWPDVVSGRAEVMCLTTDVAMSDADFASLDRAAIPPAHAWAGTGPAD